MALTPTPTLARTPTPTLTPTLTLTLTPTLPLTPNQGHALTLAGDHTWALSSFRALTRLAPEWAEGHARVSAAHAALGDHAACVAAAAEACRINPSDVWSLLQVG